MTERTKDQATAAAVREHIQAGDRLAALLGVELVAAGPGSATATMTVRPDMANSAGIGHGGATFALADIAFACACNARNRLTLAAGSTITYTAAVAIGDVLTAEARETFHAGRRGVYDITVTNQRGETVALFQGQSRTVGGDLVDGLAEAE